MAGVEELGGAPRSNDSGPLGKNEPNRELEEGLASSPEPLARPERARKGVGRGS